MSGVRRIAGLVSGRWTKWVVLVFWIVVFAVAGPLAGKLNSAQQNDSSAWLPKNAESTQVVELAKRFAPSDVFPALVVYERPDGPITPADRAKVAADVQRFAGVPDVTAKVSAPVPANDARARAGHGRRRRPAVRRRPGRHREGHRPGSGQGRPGVAGGRAGQGGRGRQRLGGAGP